MRVARELSSSKASSLAAIGGMIETEAIPVVEKYHKVMVARSGQLVYVQISFSVVESFLTSGEGIDLTDSKSRCQRDQCVQVVCCLMPKRSICTTNNLYVFCEPRTLF
ncbi:uncharacterized protein LOC9304754 isoform X2 [Arabidopsis lyrata subsp. lyrata]|uniref:uncharacterized protein LOC9304754 isoform X2 n=1 Tax=Arabidopsis lyrata subsp. lyrata TaxID=81972 RepID=UPI000A29A40E|nr:uncharacterized protein LOC9304754 isoform X2 [Arabidopsis lyrata subsp. lyrata]|eukprot:XP_020872967.1 uncharacterized protein LOC9304754 isoform X2 [Arabidopsis lyrata subsp. lyrata]